MYAWIITESHDGEDTTGTIGPRGADQQLIAALKDNRPTHALPAGTERHAFHLLDDDGELVYKGRLAVREQTEEDEDLLLSPLRDFGTPNAGCTRIAYRASGLELII